MNGKPPRNDTVSSRENWGYETVGAMRPSKPGEPQSTATLRQSTTPDAGQTSWRTREYLSTLAEAGTLTKAQILTERSLFTLRRDECAAFGSRKKRKLNDKVRLVTSVLDEAIASDNPERLLGQWNRRQGMVDPASPLWIGISLPTDMILEGHLVLEDFIQVKDCIEAHYQTSSLAPRYPDD